MSAYNWVALHVLGPALDAARGTSTLSSLRELQESQWWDADRIAELQAYRLQSLIHHAYEYVPFYRRYMREAGLTAERIQSPADLHLLPVLTRADVRSQSAELSSDYVPGGHTVVARTGGSTGEPLKFVSTPLDRFSRGFARSLRAQEWAGYQLGDRLLVLAEPWEWRSSRRKLMSGLAHRMQRTRRWTADDMSVERLEAMVRQIERSRIQFLSGFPSALYLLALHLRDRGTPPLDIRGIVTGGEPLYEHQRDVMSDTFGVVPLSKYSSNEILDIACQCGAGDGYHVAAEDVIMEILDESGNVLPRGQVGKVVVTNLHNYAMPFIRYELGDTGALSNRACKCGRGLPLLSDITGRQSDVLVTPDGRRVPGIALPWSYLADLGVRQIQIAQERRDLVRVRVVLEAFVAPDSAGGILTSIRSRYGAILGEAVEVVVEVVDEIPATSRGKRAVVSSSLVENEPEERTE